MPLAYSVYLITSPAASSQMSSSALCGFYSDRTTFTHGKITV
jgi:hypothetical protein